ncbi:hypothetical protein P691DRAFT_766390 [Macrolepiota fuliginosa MF-IS2]|uniref:Uncharacterized protein n=1 Tax=Macrolepiota fuliginosa MF-IS2 TaxID=1400762 RepID=A0A9P6BV63_9AGAR|nr:hypothetical protein P691DRAFT_766390 [Macrolepiota fuliginosa MF-IS2]
MSSVNSLGDDPLSLIKDLKAWAAHCVSAESFQEDMHEIQEQMERIQQVTINRWLLKSNESPSIPTSPLTPLLSHSSSSSTIAVTPALEKLLEQHFNAQNELITSHLAKSQSKHQELQDIVSSVSKDIDNLHKQIKDIKIEKLFKHLKELHNFQYTSPEGYHYHPLNPEAEQPSLCLAKYPKNIFWLQADWHSHFSPGSPPDSSFLVDEQGQSLLEIEVAGMKQLACNIWTNLANHIPTHNNFMLNSEPFLNHYYAKLEKHYPCLQLCYSHWKVQQIGVEAFRGWYQTKFPDQVGTQSRKHKLSAVLVLASKQVKLENEAMDVNYHSGLHPLTSPQTPMVPSSSMGIQPFTAPLPAFQPQVPISSAYPKMGSGFAPSGLPMPSVSRSASASSYISQLKPYQKVRQVAQNPQQLSNITSSLHCDLLHNMPLPPHVPEHSLPPQLLPSQHLLTPGTSKSISSSTIIQHCRANSNEPNQGSSFGCSDSQSGQNSIQQSEQLQSPIQLGVDAGNGSTVSTPSKHAKTQSPELVLGDAPSGFSQWPYTPTPNGRNGPYNYWDPKSNTQPDSPASNSANVDPNTQHFDSPAYHDPNTPQCSSTHWVADPNLQQLKTPTCYPQSQSQWSPANGVAESGSQYGTLTSNRLNLSPASTSTDIDPNSQ